MELLVPQLPINSAVLRLLLSALFLCVPGCFASNPAPLASAEITQYRIVLGKGIEERKVTARDPNILKGLAAFFPGLAERSTSLPPGSWGADVHIQFQRVDGTSFVIHCSYEFWYEQGVGGDNRVAPGLEAYIDKLFPVP